MEEDLQKGKHLFTAGRKLNWSSHYGNHCEASSKQRKVNLPQDQLYQ